MDIDSSIWDQSYHLGNTMPQIWYYHFQILFTSALTLKKNALEGDYFIRNSNISDFKPGTPEHNEGWKRENGRPAAMLLAYSIENLLKGIYAKKLFSMDNEKSKNDLISNLPQDMRGHWMNKFIRDKLEIELSENENVTLLALSHASRWFGRYATAINLEEYKQFSNINGYSIIHKIIFTDFGDEFPFGQEVDGILDKLEPMIRDKNYFN
ncbi:hypothetical protein [Croceimicrobium sp.]|uniref:hypothetical protein n=1 Tax=Croceimicrobium sp. TaxID=2828340 RepID=UPI003BAB5F02